MTVFRSAGPVEWSRPNQSDWSEGRILPGLVKMRESWGLPAKRVLWQSRRVLSEEQSLRQ